MALQNGLINAPVVTLIAFREGQRGVTGVANAHDLGEIRRGCFKSNHKFMGIVCDKLPDKERPMVSWNVRQSLTDVFTTLSIEEDRLQVFQQWEEHTTLYTKEEKDRQSSGITRKRK